MTVRDGLVRAANEIGVDVATLIQTRLVEHGVTTLPDRYRQIVEHVWLRLPEGWDSHAHWELAAEEADNVSAVDGLLAGVLLDEHEPGDQQRWTVYLQFTELAQLSDDEVSRIVAHEFAHVATGFATEGHDKALEEDRANFMMRLWGFEPRSSTENPQ